MAATLWQGRWLIMAVVAMASLIGIIVLQGLTPRYKAEAVIALDRASNYSATFDTPLTSLVVDGETVASEIELIYSRELIGQVVTAEKLLDTEEYNPELRDDPGFLASTIAGLKASVKSLLPADDTVSDAVDPVSGAIDQFRDNLDIQRKGISRAIVIGFEAQDPERAAELANALATRYIDDQQTLQRDQEGVATGQLEAKMEGVREQLRATEQEIEEQRRALGQVTPDGASKIEQRLAGLNTRLITADAELAAAQAELQQARALRSTPSAIDFIPATQASAAVAQLRERELDLQSRQSELATKYGQKHPLVRQVANQLSQTRDSLNLEIDKTIGVLQSKATIVASRQRSIEQEMERLETREAEANPTKAALVGLQREAGSLRDRIAFLERRISEVSQVNSLANLRPFARVISTAQVPLSAAFPKKTLLLPLIALLAGMAAVAALLGKFLYRHQLRARLPALPNNVAWVASFPCGSGVRDAGGKHDGRRGIADAALINVQKALPGGEPNTVMVTALDASRVAPADGSVAWRLASASAERERRTLYVDLRPLDTRPAVTAASSQAARRGSGEGDDAAAAFKGLVPVAQAVKNHPTLPLDSLSAEGMLVDAAMLLSGERLRHCLEDWGNSYHTIIIDAPPVLNSPNAALINQSCSVGLLVGTLPVLMRKPEEFYQALQRLRAHDQRLTGVVVDELDDALFQPERFSYERSEHYLERLTSRPPAHAAPYSTARTADHLAADAVRVSAPTTPARPSRRVPIDADRMSNVISLRRNKSGRSRGQRSHSQVHGEAWVLQQAPERFTIRLNTPQAPRDVGKSLNYLAEFLPLAWYSRGSDNKAIPVLIVGLFDSSDEVRAMLDSAAMASIADGAEPCVLAQIQAEIVNHRQAAGHLTDKPGSAGA